MKTPSSAHLRMFLTLLLATVATFAVALIAREPRNPLEGKAQGLLVEYPDVITIATKSGPNQVMLQDMNSDGILDIVTVNSTDGTLSMMMGVGNGMFQAPITIQTAGKTPYSVAAGHLNSVAAGHLNDDDF